MVAPEDDDESSKTEEPSERKISKAKEEGDVAISQEAKSFIMLLGMLFVVWLVIPLIFRWYYLMSVRFIESPGQMSISVPEFQLLLKQVFLGILKLMGIPFALFMVLGIFASIAQTGFIYAPQKLLPNWNKLNIFAAIPNFISVIAVLVIRPYLEKANLLPTMESISILQFIHKAVTILLFTVVLAVLVLAVLDFAYQKYMHLKKLRMTKQEVKEEYKQMEGDPLVKSKIRQIRMERARHRMMENVPKADVVIVNPTHYAVALEYKMETMDAPKVTAKGIDNVALRIKALAEEHDVPIVENPPLARALFASTELDQTIPQEHFKAVAEVIGYVMQLKNQQ